MRQYFPTGRSEPPPVARLSFSNECGTPQNILVKGVFSGDSVEPSRDRGEFSVLFHRSYSAASSQALGMLSAFSQTFYTNEGSRENRIESNNSKLDV